MRIGFSGHQGLTLATRRSVAAEITRIVSEQEAKDLIGLTSLAEGSDQVFAFSILAAGGDLHAVIPSSRYEESFTGKRARKNYHALLELTTHRTILSFPEPSENAYLEAGHTVVDNSDLLITVWDGRKAAGKGGTGDIVDYAKERGVDFRIVWPAGAQRM